ncbi:MAG: CNNM domain-containing protein [Planctomycetota bacterium]
MIVWLIVGLIVVGLFLSAFFSGAETGLYCANRLRLQLRAQQREPAALRLAAVLADERGTLAVTLVGVNVADYVLSGSVAYLFDNFLMLSDADAELYTIGILAPVVFVFANVIPKNLFFLHADSLMLRGSWLLSLFDHLFRLTGVIWCLARLAEFLERFTGVRRSRGHALDPRHRMATLLRESLVGQPVGGDSVERLLQLSEVPLQTVMVPARLVTAIPATGNREDLERAAQTTVHSRLPVHGAHRRNIIGFVRIDDLLGSDGWRFVRDQLEPAISLTPDETIASAISTLQSSGHEMAIVAEHDGPMLGTVTLRNLLELVVGALAADD